MMITACVVTLIIVTVFLALVCGLLIQRARALETRISTAERSASEAQRIMAEHFTGLADRMQAMELRFPGGRKTHAS